MLTHQLKWKDAAAELGASTSLLVQSQSYEGEKGEKVGSVVDARLGLVTRALFGGGNRRFIVTLNGEVSPTRLRRKLRVDDALPPLPSWDVGLGIGAAWGEP